MGAAEPETQLYDFLYRDPSRVASYYAQLFGGHLVTTERTDGSRSATESVVGGSVQVVKGDWKTAKEDTEGRKETLSPHDIIATDLLARLIETSRVDGNATNAPGGRVVHVQGDLYLSDSSVLRLMAAMDDDMWVAGMTGPTTNAKDAKRLAKGIKSMIGAMSMPSLFTLRTSAGHQYVGSVKPAGLDEPIADHYYKAGADGIPNVHVIGIKEATAPAALVGLPPFMAAALPFADAIRGLFLPADATRLTPLLVYRKVEPF